MAPIKTFCNEILITELSEVNKKYRG